MLATVTSAFGIMIISILAPIVICYFWNKYSKEE